MKFLFLLIENSVQDATERAATEIYRKHGIKLEVKFWTCRQLKEGSPAWIEFEKDYNESDLFFGNMIAVNDVAVGLEGVIKKYTPSRPERTIVILNSMPSLMALTKLGDFEFNKLLQFMKNNPVSKIGGLVGNVRKLVDKDARHDAKHEDDDTDEDEAVEHKRLKHRKPVKKGAQSGMLAVMRTLPNVLKLIPGQAQDLRAYLMIMQYWLNGSPENLEELFKFVIDHYIVSYKGPKLKAKDPVMYSRMAIFHPDAPGKTWEDYAEFEKWVVKAKPKLANRPRVGLITMRGLYLAGNRRHLAEIVKQLEEAGVIAVPAYAAGLDFRPVVENLFMEIDKKGKVTPKVDVVINMSGFSMVGGPAENDSEAAIAQMERLNRPVWCIIPLTFQSEDEWRNSLTGLNPVQVALQVAIPELDGAVESRVYAAGVERGPDKTMYPLPEEIRRVAQRAGKAARLVHKANRDKKIAIVLFSFPPNKGNIGTAAYLSVFESLWRLMKRLKDEGYTVEVPEDAEALRKLVVEGNSHTYSTAGNLHTHMAVSDYQKLFPAWQEIEKFWGSPPGTLLSDHQGLQVLGRQFGNLLVGIQPSFGYEDDPMRLLMATNASPHHGFAAFYAYLDKVWDADAVLHFGTHGSLEFMPGKQVGLSARCWPDRLIGNLPNFYLYSVNNPSEGTIAKRRGFATTLSYLSPPMETAGLYKQLLELKDTINVYRKSLADGRSLKPRQTGVEYKPDLTTLEAGDSGWDGENLNSMGMLLESIKELAKTIELEVPIDPQVDPDGYVLSLFTGLLEIEERLIPNGLHILDEKLDMTTLTDILNSISSFPRGKAGSHDEALALTDLIAAGLGFNLEEIREKAKTDHEMLACWEEINQVQHYAVKLFAEWLSKGNVEKGKKETTHYLHTAAKVDPHQSIHMLEYLAEVAHALQHNNEINQIVRAFNGEFIEPSPGNDVVRNPSVLPTGRNIHAMDPHLVPTPVARRAGEKSAKAMLVKACSEMGMAEGQYPETIAMVLWGTDNIKSDGEGVAQCLY
ncbi:MAG: magnesium chelatase subunit H, partial [Chloroflexota bacterium]